MTIENRPGDHVLGIWMVFNPGVRDWMCNVTRPLSEWDWSLKYRFRYYEDDKAFDSKDKKNWYSFTIPGSESKRKIMSIIRDMQQNLVRQGFGSQTEEIIVDSSNSEILHKKMSQSKNLHMRKISTPEEARKYGYEDIAKEMEKKSEQKK